MSGYTKLFNSILASTIWRSSDSTRIVWITLLAMADKDGICEGSIPGLADLARVSIEDCEAALEELSSPDKYSRTSEHEGRRIEAIDGVGWQLLNHAKYRMKMSEDERREYNRLKQAEWRAKQKEEEASKPVKKSQKVSMTVNDSQSLSAMSAHTDTEADSDTKADIRKENPLSAFADGERVFEYWKKALNHPTARFTKERQIKVKDRLKTYSVEEICRAIDGCRVNPHNMGQNDRNTVFDDLELICRNDTNVERFMGYAAPAKATNHGPVDEMAFQKRLMEQNNGTG